MSKYALAAISGGCGRVKLEVTGDVVCAVLTIALVAAGLFCAHASEVKMAMDKQHTKASNTREVYRRARGAIGKDAPGNCFEDLREDLIERAGEKSKICVMVES